MKKRPTAPTETEQATVESLLREILEELRALRKEQAPVPFPTPAPVPALVAHEPLGAVA